MHHLGAREQVKTVSVHGLIHSASELSGFTCTRHKATKCSIEKFEFIVSERVQVNSNNSRAMSVLVSIFIIQDECTAKINRQTLSQP